MALRVIKLVTGTLQANTYIVYEPETGEGIIIDPGWDADGILSRIEENKIKVKMIVATHLHFDHVAAAKILQNRLGCDFVYHRDEESIDYTPINMFAPYFGYGNLEIPKATRYLDEGDLIYLGQEVLRVIHTPGHSPGSITLYGGKRAFVGDLIFAGSVGRTDIPGGDWDILEKSIREKIYTLDNNTILHPGHGPDTTVGYEKKNNPFVRQ